MGIKEAIQLSRQGNLDEMRDQINSVLTHKAVDKLEEMKINMAKSYFGKKSIEEEDSLDEATKKKREYRERRGSDPFGSWASIEKDSEKTYQYMQKKKRIAANKKKRKV